MSQDAKVSGRLPQDDHTHWRNNLLKNLLKKTLIRTATAAALMSAPIAFAGPVSAAPSAQQTIAPETLMVQGPGWAIYANSNITGVTPVTVTGNSQTAITSAAAGINCGIITCTLYIYRGSTRSIDNYVARYSNASTAAIAAAFAAACLPLGGFPAVVCGGAAAVGGGYAIDQFNYAAGHNQCIAVEFLTVIPINVYPTNNGYCHN